MSSDPQRERVNRNLALDMYGLRAAGDNTSKIPVGIEQAGDRPASRLCEPPPMRRECLPNLRQRLFSCKFERPRANTAVAS